MINKELLIDVEYASEENIADKTFLGTNEKILGKIIKEQIFPKIRNNMTEDQLKASDWTLDTIIELFGQLLGESINSDTLLFYHPNLEIEEEFTEEEILDWMNTL